MCYHLKVLLVIVGCPAMAYFRKHLHKAYYLQERASEASKSSSASLISRQRGEEEYEEQLPTGGGGNFSINARDLGEAKTRRSIRVTKSYNPNFPLPTVTVTKDLSQLEIKQLELRSAS
jgi:hypothetical protein